MLPRLGFECIGLRRRLASAIVTRNVEKTTNRSCVSKPGLSRGDAGIRFRTRTCHCAALSSRGSAGLCITRSHDCANGRRDVGRSPAACGVDPCKNSAQHYDVRPGLDANTVSWCANGPEGPAELLRRECVVVTAGTHPACLPVPADEPQIETAHSSDRPDSRSTRRSAIDPFAASHAGGFAWAARS